MSENVGKFIAAFESSLQEGTFVKATLGNYKGIDDQLKKVTFRLITTRKGSRLHVLYKYIKRDVAKNFALGEAIGILQKMFLEGFTSGHLFTTTNDFQLDVSRGGGSRINIAKPTFAALPAQAHNREKHTLIDPNSFYLKALGIADDTGRVRDKAQDKWRQINKFVEILANLVDRSGLKEKPHLKIIDMGCGKGYLTFAAYDHFANTRGLDVDMTGVESRDELVSACNDIARSCQFSGLRFVGGTIDGFDTTGVDILIALHACNTATDDAIYKGITSNADLIIAAPCCHQEIRPQITPPAIFRDILKHGIMLERTAETITDGLRSLLLERSGYRAKLFEFVGTEHTPKNNMLIGTRLKNTVDPLPFDRQISEIKNLYGIGEHRLETLLRDKMSQDGHT